MEVSTRHDARGAVAGIGPEHEGIVGHRTKLVLHRATNRTGRVDRGTDDLGDRSQRVGILDPRVVFTVVLAVCGLTLVFAPRLRMAKRSGRIPIATKIVLVAFIGVILSNVVTTFVESGFNLYLPDSPTSYELLDGRDDPASSTANPG